MKDKRKICVVSGARSDYGHLKGLMREISTDPRLSLQLLVTGTHLSKEFGCTYKDIVIDGFKITEKIDILKFSNTENGVTKAVGLACQKFADSFKRIKPDIVVVFGDRYEMLGATIAAYFARIPIAHIHGGEITQGLIDEGIRHSITKMANIHFAATDVYRRRIIQLGENSMNVYNFGAPCVDAIHSFLRLTPSQLSKELGFDFERKVAMVTFHPVTLEKEDPVQQINVVLEALIKTDLSCVFTKANADSGGERINRRIAEFCKQNSKRFKLFDNLGQHYYYNCLLNCSLMIGNSSSGIIEAPSFALPVINIGDRQKNRMKAENVIDVDMNARKIIKAIQKASSEDFLVKIKKTRNPYDKFSDGKVSYRIKEVLKKIVLNETLIKKHFYDISVKK